MPKTLPFLPKDLDGRMVYDPLAQYKIADLDESTTSYYGFTDPDENWYILKLTATAGRYTKGSEDYTTAWTNRASLNYDYLHEVF